MTSFGHAVRARRMYYRMTLEKLAKRIGTHKGYVSMWENGKSSPPGTRFIKRIARALSMDLRQLMTLAYVSKAPAEIRSEIESRLSPMVSE